MIRSRVPGLVFSCPRPDARARLFCFPYAGGGASVFREWSRLLPPHIEVVGVQLPGRESRIRERPLTRTDQVVETLMPALAQFFDLPYALFGHSLGALLAFECARSVRRQGHRGPSHLFVSGRFAPQLRDEEHAVHHLPTPQFIEHVKGLGGMSRAVFEEPELVQLLLPALRADFAIHETYNYAPEPPLECPITAFGGTADRRVSYQRLVAWREQTQNRLEVHQLPGGHFFLRDAHVEKAVLARVAAEVCGSVPA